MKHQSSTYNKLFTTLILVMAFAIGLFFCCRKSGFFTDEVITIGQANSSNGGWICEIREEYSNGDMTGHTITKKEIYDYLTVDDNERFDLITVYSNMSTDIHPPLYPMLLKIFYSFGTGTFSKWPGLVLNLFVFLLINFVIYKFCYELYDNNFAASITMFIYAISPSALSSLVFIRMYILLSLLMLALIYEIFFLLWKRRFFVYPLISITILFGMLTQYIFVVPAFFLCLCTFVVLIIRKDIKSVVAFSLSALSGVILLIPAFPLVFTQCSIRTEEGGQTLMSTVMMRNIANLGACLNNLIQNLQMMLSDSLPAVLILLILFALCLILLVVLKYRKSAKCLDINKYVLPKDKNTKTMLIVIGITYVLSFVFISLTANFPGYRYFYLIQALLYPFVCLFFCIFFHYFKEIWHKGSIILFVVTFIVISAISIRVLNSRPPQYTYEKYGEYKSLLLDYSHCPCIYIDFTNYNIIEESALQFLVEQDDTFVTSFQQLDSEELKKYITSHKDNDKLLVYFLGMDKSEAFVIDTITTEFGYKNGRVLVDSLQAPCYLFE